MHALYRHAKTTFHEAQRELKKWTLGPYFSLQQHVISINIYAKYEKCPLII